MLENTKNLLLIGFGDINQRLANMMKDRSIVTAIRRSNFSVDGVNCKVGDATDQKVLLSLLDKSPDQVVITLSPSDYSEQGYRSTYLSAAETLVRATENLGTAPEVLFVSSSSVYAQNGGEVINEGSECTPTRYNGQVLLEAEQCLITSHLPATIVRFSGIYGPGRYRLIKNSSSANFELPVTIQWTNRIHADDCAGVIAHILNIPVESRESLYLASDSKPVPSHVVKNWLAKQITSQMSDKISEITINNDVSDIEKLPCTGKRCNNTRLIESGYKFIYPSYKEGFPEIISEYLQQSL